MSYADTLESYIHRMDLPADKVSEGTWVVAPESTHHARIILKVDEPIVLYTSPLFSVSEATPDQLGLYRLLLELNDRILHCAYALDGDQIVLSGAHQLEDLDFGEFRAMIEDMSMALDGHHEQLTRWRAAVSDLRPAQEGT